MDVRLRNLWSQVLDVDNTDLDGDTNFFEEGGDSVAALRLVAAAEAVDLVVDIEDVFKHPTLEEMAGKCQVAIRDSMPKDTVSEVSILDQGTVDACATTCQVERDKIEDIFPASRFQIRVFESGKSNGAYVMQWVFQIGSEFDHHSLIEAWDRVQKKHQILRTRLVRLGDKYLQVVLRSEIDWQEGKNLDEYQRQSLGQIIDSGHSLFRYAIITERDKSYFVWTAHHAGFDGWTRRMIFEHLQESLSQPLEYAQRPNSISYKTFITWLQNQQEPASSGYWESVLEGFNGSECVFPLSLQRTPTTNSVLSKSWQRGSTQKSKFTMATVAYAAWAISLGNMSGLHDILFVTTRSGRYHSIPGVETIFGPMAVLNPVRTKLEKEESLGEYLQSMQTQLVSMTSHERDGYRILPTLGGPQIQQSCITWHSEGDDIFSKDLLFKNREGLIMSLKPRKDLSPQVNTNFGVLLSGYDQGSSLDLNIYWDDSLRTQSDIEQLTANFIHNLDQLVGSSDLVVGDLWTGKGPKCVC